MSAQLRFTMLLGNSSRLLDIYWIQAPFQPCLFGNAQDWLLNILIQAHFSLVSSTVPFSNVMPFPLPFSICLRRFHHLRAWLRRRNRYVPPVFLKQVPVTPPPRTVLINRRSSLSSLTKTYGTAASTQNRRSMGRICFE